jgi:phosphopantothenoylcysteine decarboxylase / phosphopantothenate---cysteine ligase
MARFLLGVSGGIAAYKAVELARLAIKSGHAVRVIQTPASERFIGRSTFEGITGAPVLMSEFEPDPARGAYPGDPAPERAPISHLALVERADLYLIAPASANTLAKLAHGLADNLLTTAALAAPCPVVVAPAMNDRMYRHPATAENIDKLSERGVTVIPPAEGDLASRGEHGIGRLVEPAELLKACESLLDATAAPGPWPGLRVLVTAGGTREPIDSVRFIGNRSSGRMGVALAARAAARGAHVTLVAANLAVPPPSGARVIEVQTASELAEACAAEFDSCDLLLMAAAVADFRPAAPFANKLKKDAGPPPPIELERTEDILSGLASGRRPRQVLIGFAAEHGEDAVAYGRHKLHAKGLDAVVVNDISRADIGFDSGANEVVIVTAAGERRVPRASKDKVADAVLDEAARQLGKEDRGAVRAHRAGGPGSPARV